MGVLRCVMCEQPVLGGPRWEARLCSGACATEALFEVVGLDDRLERSQPGALTGDDDRHAALQRVDDFRLLYRRQLLMRAAMAWHELGEVETPDGIPLPGPTADADDDAIAARQ